MEAKPSAEKTQDKTAARPSTGRAKHVDWEAVELQYRAGIRSLKDIGAEYGVSDAGIIKRAKRNGWARDLRAKIQAKAEAKVSASLVSKEVSAQTKIAERQIVEANAQAVADVRLAHRKDIRRARSLANAMLDELEQQTVPENLALLRELGELMRSPDDKGIDKRNDLYQAVLALPERSKTMKVLVESLRTVVDMERTAFGMNEREDGADKSDVLTSMLMRVATTGGSGFVPIAHDPEQPRARLLSPAVSVKGDDE